MSYPRIHTQHWDETAASNRVTVPFGHIWRLTNLMVHYVADSQSATRTVTLTFRWNESPTGLIFLTASILASETEDYILGSTIVPFDNEEALDQPLTLQPTDTITIAITNEQSGDLWDATATLEDWVVPRV